MFSEINIELTSRCNKHCWICPRWNNNIPKNDMPFELLQKIEPQLEDNIIIHFHNNGEPLLYPRFEEAALLFNRQYTHITTNGKLIIEKIKELQYLNTMAISVIENDPEADEQYEILKEYFTIKNEGLLELPHTVLRLNGKVDDKRYKQFCVPIAYRNLHDPMGSFKYTAPPTLPETGICQDLLYHPAINKDGDISICVRYDPKGLGVIGHVSQGITSVLDGEKRRDYIDLHLQGRRNEVPLCASCQYWGIPTGRS